MNDIRSVLDHLRQQANRDGLASASTNELEKYATALCHSQAFSFFGEREYPQLCETVRVHLLRAHIGNLQEHVVELHDHITNLNTSNTKIQQWVIALAVAALISTTVQTIVTVMAYVNTPTTETKSPAITVQPQKPAPQSSAPLPAAPPSELQRLR
jgi:hypothetical protein